MSLRSYLQYLRRLPRMRKGDMRRLAKRRLLLCLTITASIVTGGIWALSGYIYWGSPFIGIGGGQVRFAFEIDQGHILPCWPLGPSFPNPYFRWWEYDWTWTPRWSHYSMPWMGSDWHLQGDPWTPPPSEIYRGSIPLASVSIGFALVASLLTTIRDRHAPNTCSICGYSLIGNTSGVCPECGTAVNSSEEPSVG